MSPRRAFILIVFASLAVAGSSRGQAPEGARPQAPPAGIFPRKDLLEPLPLGARSRLGTYRLRHGRNLSSVAFASDGKTVASAGSGPVILWDLTTGMERRRFTGHSDILRSVEFSPDGKTLVAAGSFTDALYFWEVETGRFLRHVGQLPGGREIRRVDPTMDIHCLSFSPDGKTLAHVGREVRLHDTATGKERARREAEGGSHFTCAAFSPDGKLLGAGDSKDAVHLWDHDGRKVRVVRGHKEAVLCLAFSPDGKIGISGTKGGRLRLWDAGNGKEIRFLGGHNGAVLSVRFTPDGKRVISGGRDRISLWDVTTGEEVRQFVGHNRSVNSLTLSADGRTLAGAGGDGTVRLWEVATGIPILPFDGHRADVGALAFSRDGKRLISGGGDGLILWDLKSEKAIRRIGAESTRANSLSVRPDGAQVASAGWDGSFLWDLSNGKLVREFSSGEKDAAQHIAFLAGTTLLASRHARGRLRVWEPTTGKLLRLFGAELGEYQHGGGYCVASPDGRVLAVGGPNESTELWGTRDGKLIRRLGEKGESGL